MELPQIASEDVFNVFLGKFTNFLSENWDLHFYIDNKPPQYEAWGKVLKEQEGKLVYIITNKFRAFCEENGFDLDFVLSEAFSKGLLRRGDARRVKRRIGGVLTSCYCFDLKKLRELRRIKGGCMGYKIKLHSS